MKLKIGDIPEVVNTFHESGRTLGLFGAPGMGKTAMVHEGAMRLAAQYDEPVGVTELHLASMSEVDVRGFLIPNSREGSCAFTAPPWWQSVQETCHHIFFLDEFPQAPLELQKAVAPLLLERCMGDYALPYGCQVVIAGNRCEDNSGANSILSHVLNRIAYVEVCPDPEAWHYWAAGAGVAPLLLAFGRLRPGEVFGDEPPIIDTPWATPRSLHALSDVSAQWQGGLDVMLTSAKGLAVVAGLIGTAGAAELAIIKKTAAAARRQGGGHAVAAPAAVGETALRRRWYRHDSGY